MKMTAWQQWVHRPQSLWLRKAVFQIHLWTGIVVGLYVVLISVSGSAIVYRLDLGRRDPRRIVVMAHSGSQRMSIEEVTRSARRVYPTYEVLGVIEPGKPDQADAVILQRGTKRVERLFDPYTGANLGDPRSWLGSAFSWLTDLHDNLLSGLTGRTLNGVGAFLITLLSLTGTVIWWPGIKNWRRSLTINGRARFARLNWDLHSAVGFWCFLLVLIWGISGICLCFPGALDSLLASQVRLWITRLHFGRFNGITEALWTIVGLAPAVLACTGALMWWNRVLRKRMRDWRGSRTEGVTRIAAQSSAGLRR
jgi:uncharacterized iron-regulated membrane protein